MSERERFLRRFHAVHPGITASGFARGGSYARLARIAWPGARVLDLGCGDGLVLSLLDGASGIGLDACAEELALARRRGVIVVQGRAQAIPLAAASIDVTLCHLAFMLFAELDAVVDELARVLVADGMFAAIVGGGPTAAGDDAFHRFLAVARPAPAHAPDVDRRAQSEAGWRELFAGWGTPRFERVELVLDGPPDEVWRFLGASYELAALQRPAAVVRDEWLAACGDLFDPAGGLPCRVVVWLATVRR